MLHALVGRDLRGKLHKTESLELDKTQAKMVQILKTQVATRTDHHTFVLAEFEDTAAYIYFH